MQLITEFGVDFGIEEIMKMDSATSGKTVKEEAGHEDCHVGGLNDLGTEINLVNFRDEKMDLFITIY